ncbi:hypothetical protein FW320_13850 [Azospirillum sp. Vi22]|nr:hypothetical protein [Azospirillum baldaniorum]
MSPMSHRSLITSNWESGQIAVTVAVGKDSLDIIVADTGIGIPAERMSEVGMPFTQFNDAHSRRYAGTGLGLHIAKSLAEQHGGSLDVDSQPDVGTTVTIRLPRTRLTTIRELLTG